MAAASEHQAETALRQISRWLSQAPWGALAQLACRFGYAARGFVYLSIGLIAGLAAVEQVPDTEGSLGAMEAWSKWPLGFVLLWATGLGLYGFSGWRILQSVFDAERRGTDAKALADRAGKAVSAAVYGVLGFSVFGAIDVLQDLGDSDSKDAEREAVEKALNMPGGEWLVVGVGAFILAAGVANMVKAMRGDLCSRLRCEGRAEKIAEPLGRLGYGSRGIAFVVAGGLLAQAGLQANAAEAAGLSEALQFMETLPFGSLVLLVIAAGLVCFGLFAFFEARYRMIPAGEVVED